MKDKKFKSGLIALIVILVIVISVIILSCLEVFPSLSFSKPEISTNGKIVGEHKSKNFIATVYLEGTIEQYNSLYSQEWILNTISKLKDDENNVGMVLYIDSPGGGVYQADEVYLALEDYKKADKKIYVYMGPMAASGGYYIACAADAIYANRNTLTGSIGVIAGQSFDLTGLFEKNGIKSETIHAGKNKNMGNYNEPLSDEQRTILQSVADECYQQFVSIVAESRDMNYDDVVKLADGRIYTAKQALNNGLIDGIKNWNDVIETAKFNTTGSETSVKEFKFEHKQTFAEMMLNGYSNISNSQAAAKIGLPQAVLDDINHFNSYPAYLYK